MLFLRRESIGGNGTGSPGFHPGGGLIGRSIGNCTGIPGCGGGGSMIGSIVFSIVSTLGNPTSRSAKLYSCEARICSSCGAGGSAPRRGTCPAPNSGGAKKPRKPSGEEELELSGEEGEEKGEQGKEYWRWIGGGVDVDVSEREEAWEVMTMLGCMYLPEKKLKQEIGKRFHEHARKRRVKSHLMPRATVRWLSKGV
ncbi:Mediator of RNA polymerase II transcription subunit 4 [Senna tora]|uniref:Mediator of RNA polymerase II transcription subunit 4 n=1 Tax=Senna tora TaxID=362788 RepID=A0A834TBJ6_9FABA|nr:Mediator of RNA polymerase II transcription subunit 4 [Senna tora]